MAVAEGKKKRVMRNKESDDYVDNKKFAFELTEWINENKDNGHRKNWTQMSSYLANCLMKIVEHFSRQSSWRGYCVDEETEALTQRGWLDINKITTDDIILSYDKGDLKWSKIKSIFRDDYDGNMFKMTLCGMDALVTPKHKFITDNGLKEVDYLIGTDKIILTGNGVKGDVEVYSDAFVEIIGWIVTEGNYYNDIKANRNYTRVTIYQNEGIYADRIRKCLSELNSSFSETKRRGKCICFNLTKDLCIDILKVSSDKNLSMEFILALSERQRMLLFNIMIDGDGSRNGGSINYTQKNKKHVDTFLALCAISGIRSTYKIRNIISFNKPTYIYNMNIFDKKFNTCNVANINLYGANKNKIIGVDKLLNPSVPTEYYKGKVWCPETEYGSFMCRRNGTMYLTGNTYLDVMQSEAIINLVRGIHNFNINISPNAFSYASEIVRKSFIYVLDQEKKQASIKNEHISRSSVYNFNNINLYDQEEQ